MHRVEQFAVVMEHDIESEVYVTYVPALGGISTYGDTEDEALEHTREMIEGWFKAARKHPVRRGLTAES